MLDYKRAAALFEDRADSGEYFDSASAERSRSTLRRVVGEEERRPLFLLGEPGVGKSHMLETVAEEMRGERLVVHLKEPFFEPKDFLERLLREIGEKREGGLDGMKRAAVDAYGRKEHLIMIDEAQILDEKSLEFLRILADTKAFRLLLSMHRKEGEEILAKPHFRTRSHRVVEIGALSADEVRRYVEGRLAGNGLEEVSRLFEAKHFKRIYRYTGGNFRTLKRMVQTLFEIMDYAKCEGLTKYAVPNGCTIDMAALDLELIDE